MNDKILYVKDPERSKCYDISYKDELVEDLYGPGYEELDGVFQVETLIEGPALYVVRKDGKNHWFGKFESAEKLLHSAKG